MEFSKHDAEAETNYEPSELMLRQPQPLAQFHSAEITMHAGRESHHRDKISSNLDMDKDSGYSDISEPGYENIITLPYDHVASLPGKGVRERLIKVFNTWYQVPASSLDRIIKAVDILHTSSLLIDDIQDDSSLRRGSPAAHIIYGVPQTINSANYMYFQAIEELSYLKSSSSLLPVLSYELLRLHLGQGMELYWRELLQCPSESEYVTMVCNKTGGLFRLAIKLLECESEEFYPSRTDCESSKMIISVAEQLGIVFQIRDDYQNLASSEYHDLKGTWCEDLTEGKFSYPVIHSINSDKSRTQLLQILKLKSKSVEVKRLALDYMEKTGSLAHTRKTILSRISRLRALADDVQYTTAGGFEAKAVHLVLDSLEVGV